MPSHYACATCWIIRTFCWIIHTFCHSPFIHSQCISEETGAYSRQVTCAYRQHRELSRTASQQVCLSPSPHSFHSSVSLALLVKVCAVIFQGPGVESVRTTQAQETMSLLRVKAQKGLVSPFCEQSSLLARFEERRQKRMTFKHNHADDL